jgi:hypothetical protein
VHVVKMQNTMNLAIFLRFNCLSHERTRKSKKKNESAKFYLLKKITFLPSFASSSICQKHHKVAFEETIKAKN